MTCSATTLSVMVVKATAVRRLAERDPRSPPEAGEIEEIGRRALVEVRGGRSPATGSGGFSTELDGARKALAGAGIDVTIRESGGALPAAAESVFGWAVPVRRDQRDPAQRGQPLDVDVDVLGEHAVLEIRDNGTGDGDTTAAGNGLRGIAERVRAAGGTVESGRCRDGGFRLAARIPLVVEPQLGASRRRRAAVPGRAADAVLVIGWW